MENEPRIIIPEDQEYDGMKTVGDDVFLADDAFEAEDKAISYDEPQTSSTMDYKKRNNKIFLWGSLGILILTAIAFGIIHFQYINRLRQIGENTRQFSDLEYRGSAATPVDTTDEEEEDKYSAEDLYFDERPYMQRDTTRWATETVIAETPATSETAREPGESVRFKGKINNDDMLFILEESETGKLHGQFYNQTINKAFTVDGQRNGNKIQLRSVGHSNWQFTIVKDGDSFKGVATDGQSTYDLRLR